MTEVSELWRDLGVTGVSRCAMSDGFFGCDQLATLPWLTEMRANAYPIRCEPHLLRGPNPTSVATELLNYHQLQGIPGIHGLIHDALLKNITENAEIAMAMRALPHPYQTAQIVSRLFALLNCAIPNGQDNVRKTRAEGFAKLHELQIKQGKHLRPLHVPPGGMVSVANARVNANETMALASDTQIQQLTAMLNRCSRQVRTLEGELKAHCNQHI